MRRTTGKASDMADDTATTVAGGRLRGKYAASGELASCDDALALAQFGWSNSSSCFRS
jgi:hypothetical protein